MTEPALPSWRRRLPLVLILLFAALGAFLLRDTLSFEALAEHRARLEAFRDANYLLAVLLFVAAYIAIVTLSLPGATVATLTGGFLFGTFPGVLYNVAGATTGAALLFLAVRSGLGAGLSARLDAQGGAVARVKAAIEANRWSALFLLRLVPAVPFFVANLIPAFLSVPLWIHVVTTLFGILPASLVFTSVGAGLGAVFDTGGRPDLGVIFTPPILLPLLGLCALAALPVVLRALRRDGAA